MNKIKVPCEVYSRVVGYMRPVSQWNKGQKEQFEKRAYLEIKDISDEERGAA